MRKHPILIHVSDLHFGDQLMHFSHLQSAHGVFSKRLLGLLNYRLFRSKSFLPAIRQTLLQQLETMEWDYLVISGDLTILALEKEFLAARKALDPIFQKGKVFLTAGNHDRYVSQAVRTDFLKRYFGDCFPWNQAGTPKYYELTNRYVIYEIDQSLPRPPFSARGRVQTDLKTVARHMKQQYPKHKKIVFGHYPAFLPQGIKESFHHRLANQGQLQDFLLENDVDLYLHGHLHRSWAFSPSAPHNLVSVNSGGCCRHAEGKWAGFHRITLGETPLVERIHLPVEAFES